MTDARTALACARLHLRDGKRRFQQGFSVAGIAALFDAVLFGMRYYIVQHEDCESLAENTDLWDGASLFHALARAGVFDDPFIFNRFSLIVERVLWQPSFFFDADSALADVETMLMKLGIAPFDESTLPGKSLIIH